MGKFKEAHLVGYTSKEHLHDIYWRWLCELVGATTPYDDSYFILLKKLYNFPFEWHVPNDDNRISEGLRIREAFVDDHDLGDKELDILNEHRCSFLEVIISLAIHMDDLLTDFDAMPEVGSYFWELLENVGLTRFTDDEFYYKGGNFEVSRIILNILTRDYGRNGEGGLFPLRETSQDQRKVELWYQMHAYLEETHSLDSL